MAADHAELPESYVRPEAQLRPRLSEVVVSDAQTIPVVDLADDPDSAAVVARIRDACRTHGFFQVLNHGVPVELTQAMLALSYDLFRLPAEEVKAIKLYSDDDPAAKKMRQLYTSFSVRKETVHNWPDSPPSSFRRETMSTYCAEVRKLGLRLYGAISDSLGLEEGYYDMERTLLDEQEQPHLYLYPMCPAPELTYGLTPHTDDDPNALSIVLMDQQDVAGLQVLRGGKWITISGQPSPGGALVVSFGHQLRLRVAGRFSAVGAAVLPREPNTTRPGLVAEIDPDGGVSVHALVYCSDGLVLDPETESIMAAAGGGQTFTPSPAYALQVLVDESVGAEYGKPIAVGAKAEAGEEGEHRDGHRGGHDNLTAVLGIMAASSAINAVAAGAITPVAAFGFAVLMFAGVFLVMAATVRGARLG